MPQKEIKRENKERDIVKKCQIINYRMYSGPRTQSYTYTVCFSIFEDGIHRVYAHKS